MPRGEKKHSKSSTSSNAFSATEAEKGVVRVIVANNTSISKVHATISLEGSSLAVRDNNSSNGTKVNGVRINPGQSNTLNAGDTLQLGEVSMTISQL